MRNPLRGEHFDRSLWEAYLVIPGGSIVLARVQLAEDGAFEVGSREAFAKVVDLHAAFELAAGLAMATLSV